MTTTALDPAIDQTAPERRPASGWIDRVLTLPDRAPGPTWAWYVAFTVALLVGAHLPVWMAGIRSIGDLEPFVIVPAAIIVYGVVLIAALRRVAAAAFEDFRPALGIDDGRTDTWKRDLLTIPDRPALAAIVIAALFVNAVFFGSPSSAAFAPTVVVNAIGVILWEIAVALGAITLVFALRQLRMVSRLHRLATNVDVFEPGPINAFSRLTAATSLGLLLVAFLLVGPSATYALSNLLTGVVLILVAIASFVLPLRGMHDRLASERSRLLSESHARLRSTLERIHSMVDSDEIGRADQLQSALASLLSERDLLMRLSTWPWSAGTFRGIASAVALPIALWLIFRVLERVI
jgi:hypothetical protein